MADIEKGAYQDQAQADRQDLPSRLREGLVLKHADSVNDSAVDPRFHLSPESDPVTRQATPDNFDDELDKETIVEEPLYVEFEEGDPRNPVNYSNARKWAITSHCAFSTLIAATTAVSYSIGIGSMCEELHCTTFRGTIGTSVYALGFGIVPLFTASLSEEFGRQPLYFVSAGGFFSMFLLVALAPNLQAVLVARFLQGGFGSTWATMVGGSIADIWMPHERGLPMSLFAIAALGGTGVGPVTAGWIEMNPKMQWKWIEWILMITTAVYIVMLPFIMRETRSSILLRRIARNLRKETGNMRYRARVEDERVKLGTMILVSCTRPIHLLFTEPIVFSFSLWIGFAWGVTFALLESIPLEFEDLHGFNIGEVGNVFCAMIVGTALGFFTSIYQERLYQANIARRGPEARLYGACFAAVILPIGMFIYAWTSFRHIHWIAQVIGIVLIIWPTYVIYLAVFTYLADAYGPFASSALAGQSLCRNIGATAFPLFTVQMFNKLGYTWAATLFACVVTCMVPIPFILFFYGPKIRAHSQFSRQVLESKPNQTS